LAAMQRASMPEEERRDFYLYVDEFQNFATDSFAVILSEARKYHLNLIMTNQFIAQMVETVRDAVFGNVGTLISFRIGAPDADALQKEFEPVFEANDLVNLDNYHVYVKMSIDGVTCPAFSAVTLPRSAEKFDNRDKILDSSRALYSRARDYVESQMEELSTVPKIEEIMTKAEKKLVPKIPPKIGETYYREIQTPGDVRWYLGGGTEDQPLNEDTVQEKVQKTEEKAQSFLDHRAAELETQNKVADWEKERIAALETANPAPSNGPINRIYDGQAMPATRPAPQSVEEKAGLPAEALAKAGETDMVKPETDIVKPQTDVIKPETAMIEPVQEIEVLPEKDDEFEKDKDVLLSHFTHGAKPLADGQTIHLDN